MVLAIFALAAPILVNIVINLLLPLCNLTRRIPFDTRDLVLTLVQAVSMEMVLTNFIKRMTGRLRPCFYDMCGWQYDVVWDGVSNLCTYAHGEREARQSFPSGHASFAWASMLVLTVRSDLMASMVVRILISNAVWLSSSTCWAVLGSTWRTEASRSGSMPSRRLS
jgi:membrane-associated phospholipid phosphatase